MVGGEAFHMTTTGRTALLVRMAVRLKELARSPRLTRKKLAARRLKTNIARLAHGTQVAKKLAGNEEFDPPMTKRKTRGQGPVKTPAVRLCNQ